MRLPTPWRRPSSGIGTTKRGGGRSSPASSARTMSDSTPIGNGGSMTRRLAQALTVVVALLPVAALAVTRPPTPRLHPRDAAPVPSYVEKVEKAMLGLKVRARVNAPSSARLGVHRVASAIVVDPRGYALTVSYAVMDAVEIAATRRDGRTASAAVAGFDLDSGLALLKLAGGDWPAARLGQSGDVTTGTLTGTVGIDEDNDLVYVSGSVTY